MGRMINIQMDSDDMIEALVDRVGYWTDDSDKLELFEQYYEHAVDNGYFDESEFDVMSIVDNDYVNNTTVITREEFEKDREEFIKEQLDSDGFSDEDRPTVKDFEDKEDFEQELETFNKEKQEALEQYEEDTPEWDDIEYGENNIEFLEGSVEAKTNRCLLVSY